MSAEMTPDFRSLVRRHLPALRCDGAREVEVVEELARLLEDAWAESPESAESRPGDEELARWMRLQIPHWHELAELVDEEPAPPTSLASAPRRPSASSSRWGTLVHGCVDDLRVAMYLAVRSPGFTAIAVLTLALGIGLNSAVFSLVESVLFRPAAVADADRLVRIYSSTPDGFMPQEPMSNPDFVDVLRRDELFDGMAGFAMTQMALQAGSEAELVVGEMVTGGYFESLGLRPASGRTIVSSDDRRGQPAAVAVLSHRSWKRRFGGDPQVVGDEILLNGRPVTIIGIMPEPFRGLFPAVTPELWIPVHLGVDLGATPMQSSGAPETGVSILDNRARRWLWTVARLRPDTSVEVATEAIAAFGRSLATEHPESNETTDFTVLPFLEVKIIPGGIDQGVRFASYVLLGLVALVLMISSANLASMLLARASSRRREIATRLSLGASRWRLIRQLLVESLVLALLGGGLGLVIAAGAAQGMADLRPLEVVPVEVATDINWRVVAFTFAVSTLSALLFGLAPAFEATRTDLASTLREEGGSSSGSRRRRRLQSLLVAGQVAFSTVLLVCAALSLRSAHNAGLVETGFDASGVATAQLDPVLQGWDRERIAPFYDRLDTELANMPGVEAVAFASHLPLTLYINTWQAAPVGREEEFDGSWPEVDAAWVDGEYFRALGIPIERGRVFEAQEAIEGRNVVMINRELARRFWPGESAVGKWLRFSAEGDPQEVIGVVADGRYRTLGEAQRGFLYTPLPHSSSSRFVIARMADGDPQLAVAAIRRAVRRIDDHLAISSLSSVDEAMSPSFALPRMGAAVFGIFGLLGLLIAAIGLYGVLAYTVSQRTQEIGVRVAIGADGGDIVRLVLRQGILLTASGLAAGLAAAYAVTTALGAILYGIGPHDLSTFVGVAIALLAVAIVACWLPAWRAVRIDPLSALRFG